MGLFSSLLGNAGAVDKDKLQSEYANLLSTNEEIEVGFKLIRDRKSKALTSFGRGFFILASS